ncbi:MAG: ABC transporter ATP-binding protein [Candidatus Bathyarchaeia archaeon]
MGVALLKTKNLSKFFGRLKALDQVDIEIKRNQITLVMGPNGSGKTTLINTISGFYKADEGKVFLDGQEITNSPPHEIYTLGIVRTFQIPQPLKRLTVLENLMIAEKNPGEGVLGSLKYSWKRKEEELAERAFKYLEFLDLDHLWNVESYKLSGGQLKLLEVGRALMSGAKIILMDEPASGIYPKLAHELFSYFVRMKNELGITFLIIEHRLEIALPYVDYAYAMSRGRMISEGMPKDVLNDPLVIESYIGE